MSDQRTDTAPRALPCGWCGQLHRGPRCPHFAQLERGRATVPGMDVVAAVLAPQEAR